MRIVEAVKIINKAFNYNIDPRGDLSLYHNIIDRLNLRMDYTIEELERKILNYKIKQAEEEMKTTIKNTEVGKYQIDNIEVNTTYTITHLEGEEPKIEKNE